MAASISAITAGTVAFHPSPTEKERVVLEMIDPQQLPFDPAAVEGNDHEVPIFVAKLGALFTRLRS